MATSHLATSHLSARHLAARGIAAVGIAVLAASSLAPAGETRPLPIASHDIRLAATAVPPGGLVTSFLGNQVTYCSIVCPGLVETGVTAVVTTLQAPITFVTALQSGDLLRAIGAAAASVTGPTTVAATAAIDADGTLVAPRALNAFEVGVVGLLDVVPAVADGLPGVAAALESARRDTFAALNAPIVPNPAPLARPEGIVQVAVVAAINVVAAVIFPAFNDVLAGAFEVPDAVARELAATGDPVRAAAAGVFTGANVVKAAAGVITASVVAGVRDVRAAAHSPRGNVAAQARVAKPAATAVSASDGAVRPPHRSSTAAPRSRHGRAAQAGAFTPPRQPCAACTTR